jgi:hypothetical protein
MGRFKVQGTKNGKPEFKKEKRYGLWLLEQF